MRSPLLLRAVKTSKLAHHIYGLEGMPALKPKRLLAQITMDMDYDILFTAQDMDDEEWCSLYFITMLYAARKIKKENIIDALRDEMA